MKAIITHFEYPPIPIRDFDWSAVRDGYDAGDLVMPLSDYISAELDAFKLNIGLKEVKWDDTDILELLQEDINQDGIKWRLNVLNEHMRPMVPGDFGIIAGRPGSRGPCYRQLHHRRSYGS